MINKKAIKGALEAQREGGDVVIRCCYKTDVKGCLQALPPHYL